MSHLDQLRESIEARIVELKDEMAALQAARAALRNDGAASAGTTAAVSAKRTPPTRRPGARKAARTGASAETPTSAGDGADVDAPAGPASKPAVPPKPRNRVGRKPAKSERPVEVLLAGKLEAMLAESEDGLSAVTISKRSNARYQQVLDLLRELEKTGQIRRTGTRRTSRWRLITDEERIAERAAELERLSVGTS
jgi:hypothetical protein